MRVRTSRSVPQKQLQLRGWRTNSVPPELSCYCDGCLVPLWSPQLIHPQKSLRSPLDKFNAASIAHFESRRRRGITILRDKRIQYWRVALLHLAINVELHCIASFKTSLLTTPTALHRQPVETSSS